MTGPLDDARAQREGSSLVSGLRVVRERWPIVLVSVVVCVGIAMAFALTATKQYDASARLLFRSSNLTTLIDPTTANSADPQRDQGTNLLLVGSSAVATRVKQALKLPDSPDDLARDRPHQHHGDRPGPKARRRAGQRIRRAVRRLPPRR
jgi:uncharacterized protein involved in exopolysaccharide biosynthesis